MTNWIQSIMFEVYDYAEISDGIDDCEGEARKEKLAAMFTQSAKIRAMLRDVIE